MERFTPEKLLELYHWLDDALRNDGAFEDITPEWEENLNLIKFYLIHSAPLNQVDFAIAAAQQVIDATSNIRDSIHGYNNGLAAHVQPYKYLEHMATLVPNQLHENNQLIGQT